MNGGICWYCYWGWPASVREIYDRAIMALDYDDRPLQFGHAHVVWSDENFDDATVQVCLQGCISHPDWHSSIQENEIVQRSLEELLAIPESVRCCVPANYDGEHPEDFPPQGQMVKKSAVIGWTTQEILDREG